MNQKKSVMKEESMSKSGEKPSEDQLRKMIEHNKLEIRAIGYYIKVKELDVGEGIDLKADYLRQENLVKLIENRNRLDLIMKEQEILLKELNGLMED